MKSDIFGDRMKRYESAETQGQFMPLLPVVVRIDGRAFSTWTKGLDRPFDAKFHSLMVDVASFLLNEMNARIAYTQSDEITLILLADEYDESIFFDGRKFKIISNAASLAGSRFTIGALQSWPQKVIDSLPSFDCRAWQVPNRAEAVNAILWREIDASKNSVSMAARSVMSPPEMQGLSSSELQEAMFQRAGINWSKYPDSFKRGTFIQRKLVQKELSPEQLARIPEEFRPDGVIWRKEIRTIAMPRFSTVENRVDVVFDGADPIVAEEP